MSIAWFGFFCMRRCLLPFFISAFCHVCLAGLAAVCIFSTFRAGGCRFDGSLCVFLRWRLPLCWKPLRVSLPPLLPVSDLNSSVLSFPINTGALVPPLLIAFASGFLLLSSAVVLLLCSAHTLSHPGGSWFVPLWHRGILPSPTRQHRCGGVAPCVMCGSWRCRFGRSYSDRCAGAMSPGCRCRSLATSLLVDYAAGSNRRSSHKHVPISFSSS